MHSNLPVAVYTPDSRQPMFTQVLKEIWRDLKASRELAWRLMVRDIRAHYRQSLLGIGWSFIPPLVTALIFIVLHSRKIIALNETSLPYPVFAIVGTVLWHIFVYSLTVPLKVVGESKPLLCKINFPKEALILSSFGQALFNLGIKVVILVLTVILFKIPLTWGMLLSLVAMVLLILLGIAVGLLFTPLGILYTDIAQGFTILTTLWFFITPVVYPPPVEFPLSLVVMLNPVTPILVGARELATGGVVHNPILFCVMSIVILLFLFMAWIVFRVSMPIVVERLSA